MRKEDSSIKNTNQMSNDQQQNSSFEPGDQFTSQADMAEASHGRYRRSSDSESNESGSESSSEEEITDIFEAIKKGNEEAVESLLKPGTRTDINKKKDGSTPLHLAVKEGRKEIVNLLLENKADINIQDNEGNTPLHLAIEKNRKEIAQLLLEKNEDGSFKWGIDISLENKKGKKPLSLVKSKLRKTPNDSNWQSIKALLESAQAGPSGVKRPSDSTGSDSDSKKPKVDVDAGGSKRQSTDRDGNPSKKPRTDPELDEYKDHAASGVKRALDGTIYQSKLLGLFVKRAIDKEYDFRLATEMDAAEKFDDVVFKYKDQDKWTYRFLQAKHKQDPENKKITINDLISTSNDNPFSLLKYLVSFCKIKDNKLFEGDDLKDFVIITNTDFDFSENLELKKDGGPTKRAQEHNELINRWKGFFEKEEDLEKDEILYFKIKDFKAEKSKFNNNARTDLTGIIKSSLLKSALEAKEIKGLSSAKEKLEAVKVFDLKSLITEAKNAIKNIEDEYNSKKRKGEVLKEARKVSKLKEGILEENEYTDLENAIKELDKTSAKDKKDPNQNKELDEAIKNVLDKAKNISKKANEILNNAKDKLDKYKDSNSEKAKALEEDKKKLSDIEDDLKKIRDKISKSTTLEEVKTETKKEVLKERIAKTTLGEIQKKTNSDLEEVKGTLDKRLGEAISEISVIRVALNDDTLDNYLKEFLEKFRFVTNYPNEKELGGFIKDELGKEFDLLNADLVSDSFEREMLDFLKSYDKGKAEFYSWKDGEEFFKALKGKINTLMTSGISKAYPEKLSAYGIRFKENLEALKDFLSDKEQILHVSTQATRLSAIKVLQTLESDAFKDKYGYLKAQDGYIFMRLRTLLRQDTQKYAIDAFSSDQSHHLLVIECQDKTQDKIDGLYKRLSEVLDKDKKKKIILIAPGEDILAGKFNIPDENRIDDQTSFKDLDPQSQDKVLEKDVNFQGKDLSLNQLIDKTSAVEIIDHASLSRLLEGEKVQIGNQKAFSSIGYVKDYYMPRALHRQRIKTEVLKEEVNSELFFITGANSENLTGLGVENKDIHIWEEGKSYDNGIILPSSGQSDQEIFKDLVKSHPGKSIHWLEYQDGRLVWRASKGNSSALEEYIDKNNVPDGKNILREEDFSKPEALGQKVIIIANDPGVGKSTVLTSIAHKMKQENPALWVVRINLNDYAVDEKQPQNLHNIKFQEDETEKAIEFVSKMAVPSDPDKKDTTNIKFQQKLFKSGLKDDHNPKIVILFDGFDEISPSYKPNTTKLVNALKTSKVTQLWVTTRVHEKSHLEEKLESPAYILNNLTKPQQKEFLNKFWRWSLKFSKEKDSKKAYKKIREHLEEIKSSLELFSDTPIQDLKKRISEILPEDSSQQEPSSEQLESLRGAVDGLDFSDYARGLLKQWKASIKDTKKAFTDVPLNLRMLAEVVFEKKFQLPENLGLLDLYDEFINLKFNIYYDEKKILGSTVGSGEVREDHSENLREKHHELALKLFFPKLSQKRLELKEKIKLARVGLLTLKGGQLEFIHRSFAEYFLSEYLVGNLDKEEVQKLLLEKILIEKDYELIRKFFNGQLELFFKYKTEREQLEGKSISELKGKDLAHLSNLKLIENNRINEILQQAAQEGHSDIVKFLLDKIKDYSKDFKDLAIRFSDDRKNALLIAASNGHIDIVKDLLKWVKENLGEDRLKDLVLVPTRYGKTFLHLIAEKCHPKVFNDLLEWWIEENLGEDTLKALVLSDESSPLLEFLVHESPDVNFMGLLKWVKENLGEDTLKTLVLKRTQNGQTALHTAAEKDYSSAVNAILESIKEYPETLKELVLATDRNGETALLKAVYNDKKILSLLGDNKAYKIDSPLDNFFKEIGLVLERTNTTSIILSSLESSFKDDPEALEDLAILSVYGDACKDPEEIVEKLLKCVHDNSKIYKNLLSIKNHLDEVKVRSWNLSGVIPTGNKSQDYLKELVLATDGQSGGTALHKAAEANQSKIVEELLESVKKHPRILEELVQKHDKNGKTALQMAAKYNQNKFVEGLLKWLGENLDKDTLKRVLINKSNARFAIMKAEYLGYQTIKNNLLEFVKKYLPEILENLERQTGISIKRTLERAENNGYSDQKQRKLALIKAIKDKNSTALEKLLDSVKDNIDNLKDLVLNTEKNRQTALHLAARKGHTKILLALLKRVKEYIPNFLELLVLKVDVNRQTALYLAASMNRTETVKVLLGWVKENFPGILKELVLATNNIGWTALHCAAETGMGHSETVEVLLDGLKDYPKLLKDLVLAKDTQGQTALDWAAKEGYLQTSSDFDKLEIIHIVEIPKDQSFYDKVNAFNVSIQAFWEDDEKILQNLSDFLRDIDLKNPEQVIDKAKSVLKNNKNFKKIVDLLRAQYNEIASSLLKDETDIADFSDEELEVLQKYVERDDYTGQNRQEILNKINTELNNRPQASRGGLRGGHPSDAGESSNVLRLRGGASLEEQYMEGYNLTKSFWQEMRRLLEAGAIEKGELPVLIDMEESSPGEWRVPLINKSAPDQAPRYFTTEQEIFSQMKSYLQERAKDIRPYYREDSGGLSFREEVPGEAVDGLNSSFLAQAVFNWVRHGFGPELGEEMPEDLSKILKAQFYVQVSMMAHGALSDTKSVVDNVKLLMREEAMAVETFNSFEHSMLSSANSALGLGLGGAMVVLDALELSKLTDPSARAIVTTQLVFDSVNLGVGAGAMVSGTIASNAAAGSALGEVAATSSATLGYLAVPLAGIGIGVTALVQVSQQAIEQAKGVGRMLNVLKKELREGYVYEKRLQAFVSPSLAGIKKLTLTSEGIGLEFAPLHYNRFRSGWHNVEPIREGSEAYGNFLNTLGLPNTLEVKTPNDQGGGTLVMPYIPSKDYDFSLGGALGSYFRYDAEFATAQEMQRKDAGFHFQVLFYTPIPFDHIIRSYRIKYKATDVEVVVKEGNWNLIFPWVYDEGSKDAQERKNYIKSNAKYVRYSIHAEPSAKEITLGLPPLEFPLDLSLSQTEKTEVKWHFEVSHLDKDLLVHFEAGLLHIGSFKIRLSKTITKEALFFRRQVEEILESGRLTSKGLEWREVEIIAEDEDLQTLKEKLHSQINLHEGHEDYLRVETSAKDQVTYYDVVRNRYIKTPLSFEEGGKEYYAREALLLNVEDPHAYFYCPWQACPLGDKAQEKLPLLFWGLDIDTGKALHPERISFSSSEALSKCIEISPGEGFELSTKLYSGMGATFLEEHYESKVNKKAIKLLWQLTKGQKQGDLDVYLHAIEGVSKEISMESFDHLADQVMLKDDQRKVKWWIKKEKQFVDAMPASAEGAYPVPLRTDKNTQGERVCFWLLHQRENLYDLIYAVKGKEKNRLKNIKFISQVDERLILESQEGIIYEVDNDFKRMIIGLDESFLSKKKPSELKGFFEKQASYAPVLSLRSSRDATMRPLMCWYGVREDLYYMSHYEGLPTLSYKGSSQEGLGLIYDGTQKALYTLEGIRGKDLDGHYKVSPQGAVVLDRVSKQDKLATGVKSVLSDGKSLQIEDSQGCLWVCDVKRSFKKWQLAGLSQEALKGSISSNSISEKIQKAQEGLSKEKKLELEIPAFVSLGALGFYAPGVKKLILLPLQGQEVKEAQVLGMDEDYGYVNIKDKLYQMRLKDHWSARQARPEKKVLGEGKIQRLGASLILLEGGLGEEALEHLRELKWIKDFYTNVHQRRAQELWLFSGMTSEFKQRAPMILPLMDALPEGIVRIHLDDKAGEVYKAFREGNDLVIGYGMDKRELILKGAFEASSRTKVGFYLQEKGSIRKRLTLGQMVGCIRALIESGAAHEGQRIKLKKVFEHMQQ